MAGRASEGVWEPESVLIGSGIIAKMAAASAPKLRLSAITLVITWGVSTRLTIADRDESGVVVMVTLVQFPEVRVKLGHCVHWRIDWEMLTSARSRETVRLVFKNYKRGPPGVKVIGPKFSSERPAGRGGCGGN